MSRQIRSFILILATIANCAGSLSAQTDNPVYVDDSPQAWELFRQAQDQTRNNAGEAVRLYQELLDEYALRLIPVNPGATDHFRAVRQRVIEMLNADQALLARYRLIQTPQAERMLQDGQLERLALTRPLTEPGLEALLRLAQRDLESGRFSAAQRSLVQALSHSDLNDHRAVHCYSMLAMSSHFLGDGLQYEWATQQLSQLGAQGEAFTQQLAALVAENPKPASRNAISTLDEGEAGDLSDLVAQSIWSAPLEDSLLRRRYSEINLLNEQDRVPPGVERRMVDSEFVTSAITVSDSVCYINQGHTILALNRLTGRQMWSYSDIDPVSMADDNRTDALDMNVVAVGEGALVTITGHALPNSRSQAGKLICLDSETGSLRWAQDFSRILETGNDERLFAHGAPIIADGTVYVAARKVSTQMLTSAYVIAIDLATQRPRWARHITSSGGLQARVRPFCTLVYRDGMLYMASAVGAAAKIEPTTGEIRWLRRFNVPITPGVMEQARRPWEMITPVVTPRGLICLQPDQRRIAVIDLETGDLLETQTASTSSTWNMPRYLLANDRYVYAIGSDIRAFDLYDLATPLWRLPAPVTRQVEPDKPLQETSIELRGRVQLAGDSLIVPTAEGVLVADADTGGTRHKLNISPTGNPLALNSQLLLACGEQLDAYMSFARAQQMLRERIVAAPSEPEPALSLLRLGMRVRDLPLSLEAADLAMNAINRLRAADAADGRAASRRDELFALLLALADQRIHATVQEGELLYATINQAVEDPEQRVEYLLSFAQWQTDHALNKAVESYQSILSDVELSRTRRTQDGRTRPASAWAIERLARLVQERGPVVYAPQADYAAMRLRQLLAQPQPNPDELMALAAEFPFAGASVDAAVLASAQRAAQSDVRRAAAELLSVYRHMPTDETAARVFGAFVEICLNAGWHTQARAALEHVLATHGDLALVMPDLQQRSAAMWHQTLVAAAPAKPRLPRLGAMLGEKKIDEQISRPGTLVPWYDSASNAALTDAVLVRFGRDIQRWAGPDLNLRWSTPLEGDSPELLMHDRQRVLLWFGSDPLDPRATLIDAATGQVRWNTPRLADTLGINMREGRRVIREQMPNGEPYDPATTLARTNGQSLIAVQRAGTIAAIDLADGKTYRWLRKEALEKIFDAALHDSALVITGMGRRLGGANANGLAGADAVSRIALFDPKTGQPLFEAREPLGLSGQAGAKWTIISPLGVVMYGTAEGVEAFDIFSGEYLWSSTAYGLVDSQRAWMIGNRALIEDQRNRLRTIDVRDGTVSEPFETPPRGEWDPLGLKSVMFNDGTLVAHYPLRIIFYDAATGAITGSDVISDDRSYRWLLPVKDSQNNTAFILINSRAEQRQMENEPVRTRHVYRIHALSSNGKALENPLAISQLINPVQQAVALDGWLLLSTPTETVTFAMPAE